MREKEKFLVYVVGNGTEVSERKELLQDQGLGLEMESLSQGLGNQNHSRYLEQQRMACRHWDLARGVEWLEEHCQGHSWIPEFKGFTKGVVQSSGSLSKYHLCCHHNCYSCLGSQRIDSEHSIHK